MGGMVLIFYASKFERGWQWNEIIKSDFSKNSLNYAFLKALTKREGLF